MRRCRRWQPGQPWDQPAGEPSNESTKVDRGGSVRGKKPVSVRGAAGLQGPEVAAQQARRGGQLGGKRKKREGVEDRKEETIEEHFIPGPIGRG